MGARRARHRHALILVDRGLGHVHRWLPTCRCGWVGVQRRRKREAIVLYRNHRATVGAVGAARHGSPSELTAREKLPAELR